jgi:hypothetical protein
LRWAERRSTFVEAGFDKFFLSFAVRVEELVEGAGGFEGYDGGGSAEMRIGVDEDLSVPVDVAVGVWSRVHDAAVKRQVFFEGFPAIEKGREIGWMGELGRKRQLEQAV